MNKPTPVTKTYLDYFECMRYLEKKYNFNSTDYAGRLKEGYGSNAPYQNYWHWVLQSNPDASNGGIVHISAPIGGYYNENGFHELDDDDYREVIERYIFDEFGEYSEDGENLTFWVEW